MALLQGIIFLLLLLEEPTSLNSLKSKDTGSVFKTIADIPRDFILSSESGNEFLDVFVPTQCLKDNIALFKAYLDSRAKPVTLWTDGKLHSNICKSKTCYKFRRSFFKIVYFICGKDDLKQVWRSRETDYFMSAFVVAENVNHPSRLFGKSPRMPFLPPYPRASGRYVLSFENGSLFLTSEFQRKLIEYQADMMGRLLEQQRTLNGSFIHLKCKSTYACQHPSFNVTLKLLAHRNAFVSIGLMEDPYKMYTSKVINSLNNRPDKYYGGFLDALHHFGSAGFSFYVRKRRQVPKESIFILPYSCEVWVGLLASCLLLVLTYGLISKVMLKANANVFLFVFAMVAAFLQQSAQLQKNVLNMSEYRILFGIMSLMFVVMSTAFKGCLTSLLNNLPLEGEATQFVSFEHLFGTGHRLCFLENPGNLGDLFKTDAPVRSAHYCSKTSKTNLHRPRSIEISADGRDTFFTYNSRAGHSEALRRELLGRGYVETEGTLFSCPVGPEMRASSVYRQDFDATLSRAIEAGLYERDAALAEYKSRYFHESRLEPTQELVLNLADLRPFFLAWVMGMSFSVLVFIGEAILSRVACQNHSDLANVTGKQAPRRKIKKASLSK